MPTVTRAQTMPNFLKRTIFIEKAFSLTIKALKNVVGYQSLL
jgi:hypothetical protein